LQKTICPTDTRPQSNKTSLKPPKNENYWNGRKRTCVLSSNTARVCHAHRSLQKNNKNTGRQQVVQQDLRERERASKLFRAQGRSNNEGRKRHDRTCNPSLRRYFLRQSMGLPLDSRRASVTARLRRRAVPPSQPARKERQSLEHLEKSTTTLT